MPRPITFISSYLDQMLSTRGQYFSKTSARMENGTGISKSRLRIFQVSMGSWKLVMLAVVDQLAGCFAGFKNPSVQACAFLEGPTKRRDQVYLQNNAYDDGEALQVRCLGQVARSGINTWCLNDPAPLYFFWRQLRFIFHQSDLNPTFLRQALRFRNLILFKWPL